MEVTVQGGRAGLLCWAVLALTVSATLATDSKEQENGAITTIKCYQCNSWSDEGCSNLKANGSHEIYLKECTGEYDGDQPFCRKISQAIKGHTARVIRSCGWLRHPEDCYHTDDDHHIENVCQCYTDACNQASRRHDFTLLVTVALVVCCKALGF